MAANKSGVTLVDFISSFQKGMNSGLQPLLIPKDELSFSLNSTVRGGLITNRPPVTRLLNIIWPSDEVQTAVQTGLFQGACFYQPDFGPQCLIASISGRIFRFDIVGNAVTVTDVSIPGDPNPAATTQVWMWQSEKWVIINDGASLPIFYDGAISRRSAGPSVLLATLAAGYTVPDIGSVVDITLTAPYPGPFDVPVLLHGEYYQPIRNNTTPYGAALTLIWDGSTGASGIEPIGTSITIRPSFAAYLTAPVVIPIQPSSAGLIAATFPLSSPYVGPIGGLVSITQSIITTVWRVTSISGNNISVVNNETIASRSFNYPAGTPVQNTGSSSPDTVLATLTTALPAMVVGETQNVGISQLYSGPDDQVVLVGSGQYSIRSVPAAIIPPAPNHVYLINLSDAAGTIVTATNLIIVSVPELSPGRMGAYGQGQNWESLVDGKSFIVSDISRGPSGTQANDYRDAVLKTTQLTFGGGAFAIPSAGATITSMTFVAKLDASLGQGPLQIGTNTAVFSCIAPFDFTNPPPLGTPILPETLKGMGPLAQNSTILVNSDTFFRTPDGLASLILARRDFFSWGNAGISDEVNERVLDKDTQSLLPYGSSIVFDNRFITTCSPQPSSNGVIHAGCIVVNLDPVSSLQGKSESVYDGLWTGLNVLQLLTGLFAGQSRAFAFGYNISTLKIELYEILPTKTVSQFDNGYTPIVWSFETAALFNKDVKPNEQLIRLQDGEFSVDNVLGNVTFKVWYRFDTDCWTPWHEFSICANGSDPQTYPRLGLGEPSAEPCNTVGGTPAREGYTLQVKFQITGRCRFLRARFKSVTIDSPEFKEPICGTVTCKTRTCVPVPADLETYSLQTNVRFNTTPITIVVQCPDGFVCAPGYYPVTITYPPGDFVIPNPPGDPPINPNDPDTPPNNPFHIQGCESEITGTNFAAVLAELAAQQARCDARNNQPPNVPPPTPSPVITLGPLV